MARSWHSRAVRLFTSAMACPTLWTGASTSLLVLLLARLDRKGPAARDIGQNLFDHFCRDLDANLREMGVGDLAVPKRMRQFAEAFYGRQSAYLAALSAPNGRELEKALARNIFIFQGVDGAEPRRLARYARVVARHF